MSTETPVSEIMSDPVLTASGDLTIRAAAERITEAGVGSLVIGEDPIEGIVTETDLVRSIGEGLDPGETRLRELMSEPVVTVRPTESVATAGERMGSNAVKKLPVTENGRVVGIVTTTDLAHFLPNRQVVMTAQPSDDLTKGEFE